MGIGVGDGDGNWRLAKLTFPFTILKKIIQLIICFNKIKVNKAKESNSKA